MTQFRSSGTTRHRNPRPRSDSRGIGVPLLAGLLAFAFATTAAAGGCPGDTGWSPDWAPWPDGQGVSSSPSVIDAMTSWNGKLVVGGAFSAIGDKTNVGNIARWNGTEWKKFGLGTNGYVNALETFGADLVAGGTFTRIATTDVGRVAGYDGTGWYPIGSIDGIPSLGDIWVEALAEYGGELFAGGHFFWADGDTARSLARWDGSAWNPMGEGVGWQPGEPTDHGTVDALLSWNGQLIVGGSFGNIDGIPLSSIASWDGASWSSLAGGIDGFGGVLGLTEYQGDLVAGGNFASIDGVAVDNVARWDGTQWHALGALTDGVVKALGVIGDDLYATGNFLMADGSVAARVARWDGASWCALGSGIASFGGNAMAAHEGTMFFGGSFYSAGGEPSWCIAQWLGEASTGVVASHSAGSSDLRGWPSPFDRTLTIGYSVPGTASVRVSVHDVTGRLVRNLASGSSTAGDHRLAWNGVTDAGNAAPSGVYFVRLESDGRSETRKVVLRRK